MASSIDALVERDVSTAVAAIAMVESSAPNRTGRSALDPPSVSDILAAAAGSGHESASSDDGIETSIPRDTSTFVPGAQMRAGNSASKRKMHLLITHVNRVLVIGGCSSRRHCNSSRI